MKNILFVSPVKFDSLKQRHQGLALEFAKKGFYIYYINPICSNGFSCSIKTYNSNIKILDIKVPFKAVSYPFLQNIAVKLAFKLLKKRLNVNFKDCILWLAEPSFAAITKEDWNKIIYDCCDLHGLFPNQNYNVWKKYEALIAENADLVTFSHQYIKEHFVKNYKNKTLLLQNATSFICKRKDKVYNNKTIKLLSSGAHYEWVDMDWLQMLANLENIELHIAGKGRGTVFNKLILSKNVVFHGELDSKRLFEVMKECDVGLVPFKDIDLIRGVDPIKVYDYAALGLDIWAPDIEPLYSNQYISCFIKNSKVAKDIINSFIIKTNRSKNDLIPTWSERIEKILPFILEN